MTANFVFPVIIPGRLDALNVKQNSKLKERKKMKRRILLLNKETEQETNENQELHSSSDNDILSCPKCTRKLKVPYERRPAKARCPAAQPYSKPERSEVKKW